MDDQSMEELITPKQISVGYSHKLIFRTKTNFKLLMHKPEFKQLLLYDGKMLYDYNYRKDIECAKLNFYHLSNQKSIVNATYVAKYKVFMVLCEDWRLYVFRRNLELLNKFPFDSKYSVGMHYIEESDTLLLLGVDSIELVKLSITTNIHQSKFLSNIKFEIEILGNQSIRQVLDWNKGYLLTKKGEIDNDQYLFIWGMRDMIVYSLKSLEVIYKLTALGNKEKSISVSLFVRQYRYVVTGYNDGCLKVWTLSNNKKIVHTFDGHTRSIESLNLHSDKRMFWSASEDMTIRLWSLDTFTNIYTFQLQGSFRSILLISPERFIAEQEGEVCIGNISSENELVTTHYGAITGFNKSYDDFRIAADPGQIGYLTFTLDNNCGMSIFVPSLQNPTTLTDLSKLPVGVFYPPPKSNSIHEIIACPFEANIFYMLVEGGDICRYRLEKNTGIVEDTYITRMILDADAHTLNQYATTINFLTVFPPSLDTEINDIRFKEEEEKTDNSLEGLTRRFQAGQLLSVGCSKGSVIFVHLQDMKKIYARYSYHREKILQIDSVYQKQTADMLMVSMCEEFRIKIVKFSPTRIQCIQSYDIRQPIRIKSSFDKVFILNSTGEFEVFHPNEEGKLSCITSDEGNFHESKILSIDFLPSKNLVLTAAEDNKVKLWHIQKILVGQINIYENLSGAYFVSDQGDIIIAHSGKLSLIRTLHMNISSEDISTIETKLSRRSRLSISIDEFFNTSKFQIQQSSMRQTQHSNKNNRTVQFTPQITIQPQAQSDEIKKTNSLMISTHLQQQQQPHLAGSLLTSINPSMAAQKMTMSQYHPPTTNTTTTTNAAQLLSHKSPQKTQIKSLQSRADYDQTSNYNPGSSGHHRKGEQRSNSSNANERSPNKHDSLNATRQKRGMSSDSSHKPNIQTAPLTAAAAIGQNLFGNQSFRTNNYIQRSGKPLTIIEQQYQVQQQMQQQSLQQQRQQLIQQQLATAHLKEQSSRDQDALQLNNYKKITALPKIGNAPTRPLTLIEKFTQEKLLSNKVLTRRDITLNKIIMRNLVRNNVIPQPISEAQSLHVGNSQTNRSNHSMTANS